MKKRRANREWDNPRPCINWLLIESLEAHLLERTEEKERRDKSTEPYHISNWPSIFRFAQPVFLQRDVPGLALLWEQSPERMQAIVDRCAGPAISGCHRPLISAERGMTVQCLSQTTHCRDSGDHL